ncbi:MAG: hypothetical protein KAU36_05655 [candidate division Zixibacteria bacterium]|nr:hypothetical protein [candidate division Zixibacteria bacterium]
MPEDKQNNATENSGAGEEQTTKSGSPLIKYIIFGVGGLAVVLGIAFGVAFLMRSDPPLKADVSQEIVAAADKHGSETAPSAANEDNGAGEATDKEAAKDSPATDRSVHEPQSAEAEMEELAADAELDYGAIEKIMDNLAFLDYEPDASEVDGADEGMSVEDSLANVNWLESEKAALDVREKELDTREKHLNKLEKEVNKKLLILEQAESVRVSKLAKLYDGMDPRSVTNLMANLDDKTVIELLPKMKVKNASSVLSLMPAQRAARLSKQMITIAEN